MTTLVGPVWAQQAGSATVEGAIQSYFNGAADDAGVARLKQAGYAYSRLLVAERLPVGSALLAEVELTSPDGRVRYPLKLTRTGQGDRATWTIDWAPADAYDRALVEVGQSEGLAELAGSDSTTAWADIARLPALPVIVGKQSFVTPFGKSTVAEHPASVDPGSSADTNQAAIKPPKSLGQYTQRWIGLTLEDEPGTANVDLILRAGVSWRRATQALVAPASLGLVRLYLVGGAVGEVAAIPTGAPVGRESSDETPPLVVGMYPAQTNHAFRVRIGDQFIDGNACAPKMTFCATSLDAFAQQAVDRISAALEDHPVSIAYVLFAATGQYRAGEVADYLGRLAVALGIPTTKIFAGYIGSK